MRDANGPVAALLILALLGIRAGAHDGRSHTDDPQPSAPAAQPTIAYRPVLIENVRTIGALRRELGAEGLMLVLKVNRIDLAHVRQGSTLLVPNRTDPASLSPFPAQLDAARAPVGRLVIVSRRVQAFAAYDDRRLVRWGPTSTGRQETSTPAALFHTNWKSKLRRSSDNAEWLLPWYVNFENARGVSFHQFDLPGYPASHACVRLLEDDARWIYDWVDSWTLADGGRTIAAYGTPVLVFGDYDFEGAPPWRLLERDPHAADVAGDDIEAALTPHLALIAERARTRSSPAGEP